MSDNNDGLMRSLLLPTFTDAGSSDAFRHTDSEAQSEATTAVLDNRTATQVESYVQQSDADAEDSLPRQALTERLHVEGRDSAEMVVPVPAAPTSSSAARTRFFPSTDPHVAPITTHSIPLRAPPARTSSLTTHSGTGGVFRPSPPRDDGDGGESSVLDHSSMTASSGGVSSVLGGLNFLKDEEGPERLSEASIEDTSVIKDKPPRDTDETPLKDNRSAPLEEYGRDSETATSNPESHPALRFRKIERSTQEHRDDMVSEVNSNLSEMGTVIEAPGRLADVSAMAAVTERSLENGDERNSPLVHPAMSSSSEIEDLSLPMLEDAPMPSKGNGVFRESAMKPEQSSTSAIVSAAFRRLGTNLGSRSFSNRSPTVESVSAPSTPRILRKTELHRTSDQQEDLPAFILRSPGSAASFKSSERRRAGTGKPLRSPHTPRGTMVPPRKRADSSPLLYHVNSLATPLRFARGCLSNDTTLDENGVGSAQVLHDTKSWTPRTPNPRTLEHSQSWDIGVSGSVLTPQRTAPDQSYQSFEFGTARSLEGDTVASAFRPAPSMGRIRHSDGSSVQGLSLQREHEIPEKRDFSPSIRSSSNALALRTPHRIEIERADAIDILACLVERSVEFDKELDSLATNTSAMAHTSEDGTDNDSIKEVRAHKRDNDGASTFAEVGVHCSDPVPSPPKPRRTAEASMDIERVHSFSAELTDTVSTLRILSRQYDQTRTGVSQDKVDHEARMKAIDELLRSHTYAAEMKRASKSASAWLRSIGRPGTGEDQTNRVDNFFTLGAGESDTAGKSELNQSAGEEQESRHERMEISSLKAMLHSAQMKAQEKEEQARRLNEELSTCRAEIGRLRSAARSEAAFRSPNRSILDKDDDSTSTAEGSKGSSRSARILEEAICSDTSPIPNTEDGEGDLSIEASFCRSDVQTGTPENNDTSGFGTLADAKKEAVLLKAALAEANDTIRKLHDDTQSVGDAPIVDISNPELRKELDEYKAAVKKAHASREAVLESRRMPQKLSTLKEHTASPDAMDRRTINSPMLDGENFTTEWEDLSPPLPPPPDHALRSPIVAALLQQWTSDSSMHDSLLGWMDRIMEGSDPATVPPLTISSLDHQVRDGFSLHVLPLLLRRPDICVDVRTRAHRRTSYDMSVFVSRQPSAPKSPDALAEATQKADKAHVMAFRATTHGHGIASGEDDSKVESEESLAARKAKVSDYLRTNASNFGAQSSDTGGPPGSVTYSSITDHVTNQSKHRFSEPRLPPSGRSVGELRDGAVPPAAGVGTLMSDDISIGSSATGGSQKSAQGQASLMGAIGGAFGLLRRSGTSKPAAPIPPALQAAASIGDNMNNIDDPAGGVPSFLRQSPPSTPATEDDTEQHPYHRVVSAPPGRIGVTFVDYRGHAMVSDVASDSPLEGWVFPSDILIAIDEIPVSGMRVRDIVKLLTTRKDRQRALRMISSHAMSSFTLNTTTLSEVGAS